MGKSHSFSIYLLKEKYDASNALKDGHKLGDPIKADNLPDGAVLYLLDTPPRNPWWKEYWGISKDLKQVLQGALLFLPVEKKWFAITFGHTYHNLKEECYEYDFGLRVTLNSLDPEKLKSTDIVEPSNAKRQRIQTPLYADLTYFDFDGDSSILKSLTGKVRDEYKDLFNHATGAANLRISSKITPESIKHFCKNILEIYKKDDYKKTFTGIQNVIPIKDPEIIDKLNNKLEKAFQNREEALSLAIPELIDYQQAFYIKFSGLRKSKKYEDVSIEYYYEYIGGNNISINDLKKHHMILCDEGSTRIKEYSIFKSLLFDTSLADIHHKGFTYHLFEGNWYQVDNNFISVLKSKLDKYFCETPSLNFIPYNHENEGRYNKDMAKKNEELICLDKKNISISGQKQIEPCDLYMATEDIATLIHIKRHTRSSTLSHFFNQGINAVELIKSEDKAKRKLKKLIAEEAKKKGKNIYGDAIDKKIKVIFGIITHKNKTNKSDNIPLFSRISLMRCLKSLSLMGVDIEIVFIEDQKQDISNEK